MKNHIKNECRIRGDLYLSKETCPDMQTGVLAYRRLALNPFITYGDMCKEL
jgi:hypothetical protein